MVGTKTWLGALRLPSSCRHALLMFLLQSLLGLLLRLLLLLRLRSRILLSRPQLLLLLLLCLGLCLHLLWRWWALLLQMIARRLLLLLAVDRCGRLRLLLLLGLQWGSVVGHSSLHACGEAIGRGGQAAIGIGPSQHRRRLSNILLRRLLLNREGEGVELGGRRRGRLQQRRTRHHAQSDLCLEQSLCELGVLHQDLPGLC